MLSYDATDSKKFWTALSSRYQPFLQILEKCYTYIGFTVQTKRFTSAERRGKPKVKNIFKRLLESMKFKQIS